MNNKENDSVKKIMEDISILDEYELQLTDNIKKEIKNKQSADDVYQNKEKELIIKAFAFRIIDIVVGTVAGLIGGVDNGIAFLFASFCITTFPFAYLEMQ